MKSPLQWVKVGTSSVFAVWSEAFRDSEVHAFKCPRWDGARSGAFAAERLSYPPSLLLYIFLCLTEVTFPVHTQQVQKNRTGLQAQMWFLLTVSYKIVERVTPTQICVRFFSPGHTFLYLVKLIPPNSTHSDSLLKGHIGKPLVLIMLYSHPYSLSCRLITIHSLVSMWVCVAFSVWPHVCVCLRVCVQQTTHVLRTVMNHFHDNGFGAPQSPPPPPHSLFMRKSIAQAPPFIAAHPGCGVLRVCEPCQRNGIEFCAVQIKWDWIE